MKCRLCGYEYRDGDHFCPNCGAAAAGNVDSNNSGFNNNGNNNSYNNSSYNNSGYNNSGYNNKGYNNGNNGYNNNAYNNNYYNNGYGGHYTAPIRNRNIALSIILLFVTCGIYGIIWLIGIADDLNTASGATEDTSGVVVWLLTFITCGIYGMYWAYTAGAKVNAIRERSGQRCEDSTGILYLLLNIFGLSFVTYCLIQSELNKVAAY